MILSDAIVLPFQSSIEWKKISVQIEEARFLEDPQAVYRSLGTREDSTEMRRAVLEAQDKIITQRYRRWQKDMKIGPA